MKPFIINEEFFEVEYTKLLDEINVFDFSKVNTLIIGFDQKKKKFLLGFLLSQHNLTFFPYFT